MASLLSFLPGRVEFPPGPGFPIAGPVRRMMSRSDPLNKSAISEQLFRVVRITPLPESQFGGAQFRFPGFRVAPGDAVGGQRELGREEHSNDRTALPEFELVMAAFHGWFHSCRSGPPSIVQVMVRLLAASITLKRPRADEPSNGA
ncbi:hypothetical protein E1202_06515 [Saccharopolyspora karakumensis]|uniref:Uncharacterized protein n=1 Tax=Saccharopolyspora karakumensis TaxID=2530386 RepID=A0A4R5BVW9_9PSEU|nr:hypothetical protein [Saccharopolyspora karakumensis]TDD91271.1 hypothetical protein E1202_06515 [Saccharopolyspora karakumensis]